MRRATWPVVSDHGLHQAGGCGCRLVWPQLDAAVGAPLLDAPQMPRSLMQPASGAVSGALATCCEEDLRRQPTAVPQDERVDLVPRASVVSAPLGRQISVDVVAVSGPTSSSPLEGQTVGEVL